MDMEEYQKRIDEIAWYHEFDFPGGLSARATTPDIDNHRSLWRFIERQLDRIDFTDKSVLDLGCWDGYWSFYAERRGARRVLATDDRTQNWAGNKGVLLAKELLKSSIDIRLDVSVYDLSPIKEKFDIILCMGIYYHLLDPFYAFSQLRHLCGPDTLLVLEGDGTFSLDAHSLYYDPSDPSHAVFVPTEQTLRHMLEANYFSVDSVESKVPRSTAPRPVSPLKMVSRGLRALLGMKALPPEPPPHGLGAPLAFRRMTRFFVQCRPVEMENPMHAFRPPFGLHRYDERFRPTPRLE